MEKLRIAVVGYGNTGKYAVDAINAAEDMTLAGVVVRRHISDADKEDFAGKGIVLTNDIEALGHVDAALLCVPTRTVPDMAKKLIALGINTVDSYDMHATILGLKNELDALAKEKGVVSVISAGWDPGSDSVVRALLEAAAPKGVTYTNFGPGMSMGHSVAAKSVKGVKNALSMTIPLGTGIHRRMVYVELMPDTDFKTVAQTIKSDEYFSHDETHVMQVESVDALIDMGHGVEMIRKGVSGLTHNQIFEFNMKVNNPALTTQVMVACARASMKQQPGAYTMIEIPVIDLIYGDRGELIKKLV